MPVEALLVVEDEELHRGHFSLRGAARPAERYLARFAEIRRLQDAAGARARRPRAVPVVANTGVDDTLRTLMGLVLDAVGRLEEEDGRSG